MKRSSMEAAKQREQEKEDQSDSQSQQSQGSLEPGMKRAKMPKKSKHRMRAHINPMGDLTIPVPMNTDYVDWSLHYPSFFGVPNNNDDKMFCNTGKFQLNYDKKIEEQKCDKVPTIVDIGCGYGGLLFELSKAFPNELILGMEIRDKVTNFVVQKINSSRINSGYKDYLNIGVVRTNTMKTIHNYFKKESLEKMFILFADPHFKKQNHRRRIITTQLLSDYAYSLKTGGKIYTATDVKELHDWEVEHMELHPLFERVPEEETKDDPCIKFMTEGTDEAKKVARNGGSVWHSVYRKKDLEKSKSEIQQEIVKFFL